MPVGSADVALSPDQKREQVLETIRAEMIRSIQETKASLEDMLQKISLAKTGKAKFEKGEKGYRAAEVNIEDILRDIPLDEADRINEDMKNLGTFNDSIYGSPDQILESIKSRFPAILNMKKTRQNQEIKNHVSQHVWDTFYKKSTGEKTKHLLDFIRDVRGKKINFVSLESRTDAEGKSPELFSDPPEAPKGGVSEAETSALSDGDVIVFKNPFPAPSGQPEIFAPGVEGAPKDIAVDISSQGDVSVTNSGTLPVSGPEILDERPQDHPEDTKEKKLTPEQEKAKKFLLEEMETYTQLVKERLNKEKGLVYSLQELHSGMKQHAEFIFQKFFVKKKIFSAEDMDDIVNDVLGKI